MTTGFGLVILYLGVFATVFAFWFLVWLPATEGKSIVGLILGVLLVLLAAILIHYGLGILIP